MINNLYYGRLAERDRNIIKVADQLEWTIVQRPNDMLILMSSPLYPHIRLEIDINQPLADEQAKRSVEALQRYSLKETWDRVTTGYAAAPKPRPRPYPTITDPLKMDQELAVARGEEPVNEPAVVSRAPWRTKRHSHMQDSLHVNELHLSDGTTVYECMTCGLRAQTGKSVTSHSIGIHGAKEKAPKPRKKEAQKPAGAPRVNGPKPSPTGVELTAVQVAEGRWEVTCPHCGNICWGSQAGFARRAAINHDRVHAKGPRGKAAEEFKRWTPVQETAHRRVNHQAGYRFANGKLSDRVAERRWSDGSVDWVCLFEGCPYHRSDGPRGITAHYGGTHARGGTGGIQAKMSRLQGIEPMTSADVNRARTAVRKSKARKDAPSVMRADLPVPPVEIEVPAWRPPQVQTAVNALLTYIDGLVKSNETKDNRIAELEAEVVQCQELYTELQGDWQRMGELFSTRFPQA